MDIMDEDDNESMDSEDEVSMSVDNIKMNDKEIGENRNSSIGENKLDIEIKKMKC